MLVGWSLCVFGARGDGRYVPVWMTLSSTTTSRQRVAGKRVLLIVPPPLFLLVVEQYR